MGLDRLVQIIRRKDLSETLGDPPVVVPPKSRIQKFREKWGTVYKSVIYHGLYNIPKDDGGEERK